MLSTKFKFKDKINLEKRCKDLGDEFLVTTNIIGYLIDYTESLELKISSLIKGNDLLFIKASNHKVKNREEIRNLKESRKKLKSRYNDLKSQTMNLSSKFDESKFVNHSHPGKLREESQINSSVWNQLKHSLYFK